MKEEGKLVSLFGDFNGHISENEGGVPQGDINTDTNGKRVLNLIQAHDMTILNADKRCKGKWTWMRRNSKSIIDYVLLDKTLHQHAVEMVIEDEGGNWPSDPDHNWVSVSIEHETQKKKDEGQKQPKARWKIYPNMDWKPFRERLDEEISAWEDELEKNTDVDEDIKVDIGYQELVKLINKVGNETVGKSRRTRFTKDTRKIKSHQGP